ncbi:MAG: universal stress protein [Opitutales bacterium]
MKKILLCVDGSAYTAPSCEYAAWLANKTEAEIEVLYVTDLRQFELPLAADMSGSLGIQPYQGLVVQLQEMEKKKAKTVESRIREIFGNLSLEERVQFTHRTGLLVDIVEDYRDTADLVMLGKRGENADFDKAHLGSMLERVVRACRQPALVTNRSYGEIKSIALAYDGGPSTRKAVEFLQTYSGFKDVEMHVVTVAEDHDEDAAANHLREAEEALKSAGYDPICQVFSGEPETAIARYVSDRSIGLLVMGAYGHSRIRQFLIGSTTTEMLRRCLIPVLCFR